MVCVCLENDMKRFIAGIGSHNYGVGSPPVCHLQSGEPGKQVVEFLVQRPESWGASGLSQSLKVQEPRALLSKDGPKCRKSKFSLPPFLFCLDYLWIRWCPPAFMRNICTQPSVWAQTHPQVFCQLSGHLLAQSNWLIKSNSTSSALVFFMCFLDPHFWQIGSTYSLLFLTKV